MPHRVALISSSYAPHAGGVEEHVRNVAAGLAVRGHDVVVWTVDRGEHLGVREVDGVEVRYLPTPLPSRSFSGIVRFLATLPGATLAWIRAFRSFRPTVLHVHCFGPNGLYAAVLSRLTAAPLVLSSHGETFMDDHGIFERSALLRRGLASTLRRAAHVTGCSSGVLDDLGERFGLSGGSVVPNGVDLGGRAPSRSGFPVPPTVFAVGRVEHIKGFDLLIDAFADAELPRGTRLVVGGEGAALPSLRHQVSARGLDGLVSFPGRLSNQEVAEQMAGASVVVVPSRREAFGIVVLEAWRAGTPLIVTARGGPADLVTDGVDGMVVDPEDIASLSEAVTTLLVDQEMADRLSEQGRSTVLAYSWGRVVDDYEQLYRVGR